MQFGRPDNNGGDWQMMPPPPRVQRNANPTMMPPPPMAPTRMMPPAPRHQQPATKRPLQNILNTNTNSSSDDCKRRRLDDNETENLPPDVPTKTHIIFVIDFSGSMKKCDVRTKNGNKISRWNAVFECIDEFLLDQIQNQSGKNKEEAIVIDDKDDGNCSNKLDGTAMVSVAIFNDDAKELLSHVPLVGDGKKLRKALETARKRHKPCGGTGFSAGFRLAKNMSYMDGSGKPLTAQNMEDQNTVVVFLSDGRPGDLRVSPPEPA